MTAPHTITTRSAQMVPLRSVRLLDGPFRDAQQRDLGYLLSLDSDRLLHTFRLNAGLATTAMPLGGWEAPGVQLRGHSLGHYLSASALLYEATGDDRLRARAVGSEDEHFSPTAHLSRHLGVKTARTRRRELQRVRELAVAPTGSRRGTRPGPRCRHRLRRPGNTARTSVSGPAADFVHPRATSAARGR
jgi:hypothetical protein